MATIIYYHDEQLEVISTRFSKYKFWKFGLLQIFWNVFLSIFNYKINVESVTVTLCLIKIGRDPSGQDHKSSISHVSLSENPKLLILP